MSTCTCHGAIREGLPAAKQTLALVSDPLGGTPGGLVPGLNVELETMNSGQVQTPLLPACDAMDGHVPESDSDCRTHWMDQSGQRRAPVVP